VWDVEAAKAAGIKTIGVLSGGAYSAEELKRAGAEEVYENCAALLATNSQRISSATRGSRVATSYLRRQGVADLPPPFCILRAQSKVGYGHGTPPVGLGWRFR
jgi:hypothetical protein